MGNVVVRIYRGRHSSGRDRWRIADHTSGTRRLRDFYHRDLALAEAHRMARLLANGEAEAAGMTGKEAASYGRAVELLRPTGASLELVAATYAEAVALLGGDHVLEAVRFYAARRPDKVIPRTVTEAVAELTAQRKAAGASPRYLSDLRSRLGIFAKAFNCPVGRITSAEVQGWLDGLQVAGRTRLNFRRAVHTLFAFAEQRGYVPKASNPVADTEQIKVKGSEEITTYTAAEFRALLTVAAPDALPIFAICGFAGLRTAEALRLDWAAIDIAGGWITVAKSQAKTRSRRLVPILPALQEWLTPYSGSTGRVWAKGVSLFPRRQRAASKRSGVPWKRNALRHSFISARLALVHDAARVSMEAGNSPAMIFSNYRELMRPEEAEAWFAILPPSAPGNVIPLTEAA